MRIPTVTDEMVVKVIECAASPVAIAITGLDPESAWARKTMEIVADEFDDRVIFLSLIKDENPEFADRALKVRFCPTLLVFKLRKEAGRLEAPKSQNEMREVLERTWDRGEV